MNTTPLQNSPGLLANAAPAPKASDASSAPTPFTQVLSNEVAQRRDAGSADGNADSKTERNAETAQPAATTGKAPASPAKPERGGNGTETSQAGDEQTAGEAASIVAAGAELLALVAGLQHGSSPVVAVHDAKTAVAGRAAQQDAALALGLAPARTAAAPTEDAVTLAGDPLEIAAGDKGTGDRSTGHTSSLATDAPRTDAKADAALTAAIKPASETRAAPDPALLKNLETVAAAPGGASQLAPAILQTLPRAPNAAGDKLTPQVGTPAWDTAVGQKIVWMAAGAQQSASLTLNPPDLGPLQVVLHVTNSHANATFISAQPEVRQALEAALPRLREMMNDAGIQLGQANVNSGSPNQQQAPGEQAAHRAAGTVQAAAHGTASLTPLRPSAVSSGHGLVDTFA